MDVDLLSRHFAHIGARVQVRSDGGRSRRMSREGGVTLDVVRDRFGWWLVVSGWWLVNSSSSARRSGYSPLTTSH